MQKMVLALASIAVLFSGTTAARELTASEKRLSKSLLSKS